MPFDREVFRERLQRIVASTREVSDKPDEKYREEKEDLDSQKKKEEIRGYRQDTDERKRYALCFFVLSCCWIAIITILLMLQGFGAIWDGRFPFKLSENVLLAIIGSTTVNVLG